MTTSYNSEGDQPKNILDTAKEIKDLIELVTGAISIGIAIVAFLQTPGNLTQFLVEAGIYGIACYVAIWVILPVVLFLINYLDRTFQRQTTDSAAAIIIGIAVLGGGILIRSMFVPDYGKELDALGTAFLALLGVAVLAVPVFLLWYFRGSTPRSK